MFEAIRPHTWTFFMAPALISILSYRIHDKRMKLKYPDQIRTYNSKIIRFILPHYKFREARIEKGSIWIAILTFLWIILTFSLNFLIDYSTPRGQDIMFWAGGIVLLTCGLPTVLVHTLRIDMYEKEIIKIKFEELLLELSSSDGTRLIDMEAYFQIKHEVKYDKKIRDVIINRLILELPNPDEVTLDDKEVYFELKAMMKITIRPKLDDPEKFRLVEIKMRELLVDEYVG